MTMSVSTPKAPFGAFEIFQLANKPSALMNSVLNWNAQRSARKAMAHLTISQMEDIGLSDKDFGHLPL